MRLDVATRNARLDAIETEWGTDIIIRIRTGATLPATEQGSATGTLLVEITAPADWAAAASSGSKALAGDWSGTAEADGTAGHYEAFSSDGTTRRAAGTVSGPGGGGELVLDATGGVIADQQTVTITAWTITDGNAW